jgi:hypothetical protein
MEANGFLAVIGALLVALALLLLLTPSRHSSPIRAAAC